MAKNREKYDMCRSYDARSPQNLIISNFQGNPSIFQITVYPPSI